ncbi:MAG: universal stress protein [Terrimicrobiaceae bacterium]|nr:universal stress protein [Terrimicrobiaceae bacterium]
MKTTKPQKSSTPSAALKRRTAAPAQTIPKKNGDAPHLLEFRKILVPVDFSKAGNPALQYAKSLASLTGATIYLVHVLERIFYGHEIADVHFDTSKMREQVTRELGALQMGVFKGTKTDIEVRTGVPFQEIVDTAFETNADLIVMATHGYTGLQHVLMGSTTERVVRHAACPVLVVRSKWPGKQKAPPRSR